MSVAEFSNYVDKPTKTAERFLRVGQGAFGVLMLLGHGQKSVTLLGRTFTMSQLADHCLFYRMAVLAGEIAKDGFRTHYGLNFKEWRKKDAVTDMDINKKWLGIGNLNSVAFLIVDISLASTFATNYLKVIPPSKFSRLLENMCLPTLSFAFTTMFVIMHEKRRFLEDHYREPEARALDPTVNKLGLDLACVLLPCLVGTYFNSGNDLKPWFNVATGAYGAYAIWA